jgi:ABC-2 type transport system ATP-binding protein
MSLVVDQLHKRFGSIVALDGLAFEVPPGQVFGFLGWQGVPSHRLPRSTWGYLPEERGLYPRMRVLDQLVFFAGLQGVPADRARREAIGWLRRFRAEDLTGLDPVNVMLLREAFLELRDRGRTVVFSTHQMEVAEALCESVAIVDRGRMVVGGPLREVRRATGRRTVLIAVEGDHRLPWLAGVRGTRVIRPGMDQSAVELDASVEPDAVLAAAVAAGARVRHFEVADPSLEQVFIDYVGRPADEDASLAPATPESQDAALQAGDDGGGDRRRGAPGPAGGRHHVTGDGT